MNLKYIEKKLCQTHRINEWLAGLQPYSLDNENIMVYIDYLWVVVIASHRLTISGVSFKDTGHPAMAGKKQFTLWINNQPSVKLIQCEKGFEDPITEVLKDINPIVSENYIDLDGLSVGFEISLNFPTGKFTFEYDGNPEINEIKPLWLGIKEIVRFILPKTENIKNQQWIEELL